jgi:hypothetical protein
MVRAMFPVPMMLMLLMGVPAFWSWIGRHAHPVVFNGLSSTPSNDAMDGAKLLMCSFWFWAQLSSPMSDSYAEFAPGQSGTY